jgi:hypothetical protein
MAFNSAFKGLTKYKLVEWDLEKKYCYSLKGTSIARVFGDDYSDDFYIRFIFWAKDVSIFIGNGIRMRGWKYFAAVSLKSSVLWDVTPRGR